MTTEEKRIDKNFNFSKLISGIMDIPIKKKDEGNRWASSFLFVL